MGRAGGLRRLYVERVRAIFSDAPACPGRRRRASGSAEARIGELESALDQSESRNATVQEQMVQLHEQLNQVQQQIDGLAARSAQVVAFRTQFVTP